TVSDRVRYTYTDLSPLRGNNYYRLAQVDIDGKTTRYEIKNAFVSGGSSIRVVNSRVHNEGLALQTEIENYDISIFNSFGQLVKKYIHLSGSQNLDLSDLSSGIYFITMDDEKGKVTERIWKE
ncbi:MAG TPA: T9SS type A sorting domain-containing protein, partial [Saprospiraceae bacterium]|nr:T9SS type A sorting domain-containing protein [Saprospiraceae bacterium]